MKQLKFNDQEYKLVSSWDEMSEKQLLRTCFIRSKHLTDSDQVALNASRIILFSILTDVPQKLVQEITAVQWIDIVPHLNFVFETPDLSTNPIPKISFGMLKTLIGPSGMLDHSNFEEMTMADTLFIRANETKSIDLFYQLFATLWRPERKDLKQFKSNPEKWNGDVREPFNDMVTSSRMAEIKKKVPFHYIVAGFVYYWSFRKNTLEARFPNYFDGPKGSKEKQGNDYGWAGPMLQLSEGAVFGNLDKTKKQHWEIVMVEISRQIDKQVEAQAAAERANKK